MAHLFGTFHTCRHFVTAACKSLERSYPSLMKNAIIIGVPLPSPLSRLDRKLFGGKLQGYAMCLNHWLRFIPIPFILINSDWLKDDEQLWQRYRHDVASNYHPECGCPVRYIVSHEIAHFIYVQMGREERELWEIAYEQGKPSGYSTTLEESFCEAFSGHHSGLTGKLFSLAAAHAEPYRTQRQ